MKISKVVTATLLVLFMQYIVIFTKPIYAAIIISASSHDGHVPENTMDGSFDPESRWSANGIGQWIQYDLERSFTIDNLQVAFYRGDERQSYVDVQLSTNGSSWSTVWSGASPNNTLSFQNLEISDQTARYVRIVGRGNSQNNWVSLVEVKINTLGDVPEPPQTNLEGTYYIRNQSDGRYLRSVDGNLWSNVETTAGTADARTIWQLIRNSDYYYLENTASNYKMRPSVSANFSLPYLAPTSYTGNWTQWRVELLGNGAYRLINRQTGKFIRPISNSNSTVHLVPNSYTGNWTQWQLVPANEQPPVNPGGDVPADVLNLTNWKVTVPFNSNGQDGNSNKAMEITQPELNNYELPGYFEVNAAGTGVIFKAHAGGATTEGSDYPRTELREMTADGSDEIEWSSSSGRHELFARLSINGLPEEKQHVVVAQIHDGDDIITFRLEEDELMLEIDGSDGPEINGNYQLGTVFTLGFIVENNQTRAYYNGNLVYTLDESYDEAYFKVGAYTQSACEGDSEVDGESCAAAGVVEVFDVTVSH